MNRKKIVLFSLFQVAALVYAILITAAFCKIARLSIESGGHAAGLGYITALLFRDFGAVLFAAVLAWALIMLYYSSPFAPTEVSTEIINKSGAGLAIFYALAGTFFALCALVPMLA